MTKEDFIENMANIQEQIQHDDKCSKAFATILPNDYTSRYDNHKVIQGYLNLIKKQFENYDYNTDWIEYYLFEYQEGWEILIDEKPFFLTDSASLYKLLTC